MSPDTFKGLIRTVIEAGGMKLKSSEESNLSALARSYSTRKMDIPEVLLKLEAHFPTLDRHQIAEIEKRLKRY